jgi:predicted deacylase
VIFTPHFELTVQVAFAPPQRANTLVIGQSAEGRDILAYRFGSGDQVILLVGGIHAGYEANTVALVNELIEHFERAPQDVLPGITLMLIPVANPDGFIRGRRTAGRFNAGGVDLNRNWGCGWSPEAQWRNQVVDPGSRAFSEPETQALAQFIRELRPSAVVFYHSAASGVFAGNCEGDHGSLELASVIGEAANYPYGEAFSAYPVTGTAASWVDGQGIPSVDLELTTTRSSEFVRNLNGVMAVQCWLIGDDCS